MFMLVSWFGLTLPLLNAADWFRSIRLLKRLFVSSHLSEVIYVWCYCWRYCRSEERFSRNAETDLVCRLLLEKKNFQRQVRAALGLHHQAVRAHAALHRLGAGQIAAA